VDERWLPVPGFEEFYQVSDEGRVKGIRRSGSRGGVLKPTLNPHGYLSVSLRRPGIRKERPIHRIVAAAFLGPRPEGMEVRHGDGDPTNNRLSNLSYGTHAQNMMDMIGHGRGQSGKTHCPEGHPYDDANTIRRYDGGRECRTCVNAYHRRLRTRQAAERQAS